MDYCYFGGTAAASAAAADSDAAAEGLQPILVVKDGSTDYMWASCTTAQGVNTYAVQFLAAAIRDAGHRKLQLQSDQEVSIMALKTAVREHLRDVEILLHESPVGDPQANGAAEPAVREVKK